MAGAPVAAGLLAMCLRDMPAPLVNEAAHDALLRLVEVAMERTAPVARPAKNKGRGRKRSGGSKGSKSDGGGDDDDDHDEAGAAEGEEPRKGTRKRPSTESGSSSDDAAEEEEEAEDDDDEDGSSSGSSTSSSDNNSHEKDDDDEEDNDDENEEGGAAPRDEWFSRHDYDRYLECRGEILTSDVALALRRIPLPDRADLASLLKLLAGLTGGYDEAVFSMADAFGPMMIRPPGSVYMSVRHLREVPLIRIAAAVLIDRSDELTEAFSAPEIVAVEDAGALDASGGALADGASPMHLVSFASSSTPSYMSSSSHLHTPTGAHHRHGMSSVSAATLSAMGGSAAAASASASVSGGGAAANVAANPQGGESSSGGLAWMGATTSQAVEEFAANAAAAPRHHRRKTPPRVTLELMNKRRMEIESAETLAATAVQRAFSAGQTPASLAKWLDVATGVPDLSALVVSPKVWATPDRVSEEKRLLKRRIFAWERAFEEKHKRVASRDDRAEIRSVIVAYANLKTLLSALQAQPPTPPAQLLLLEKKSLQAVLKLFEWDFEREHGRPVEAKDIVGREGAYARYKELKEAGLGGVA